ncbi:MAG: hypothetical protein IJW64_04130 [Clostridia bacterium]|nr:hypothetical protein [Clostridia bacterium]
MKIKFLILAFIISLVCAFGFACKKPSSESSSESTPESNFTQADVNISVNQSSIVLGVGDEYTLTANAQGIETVEFSWTVDGDSPTDVVSLAQNGNSVVVTAEKIGQTKLLAVLNYNEHTYFESVDVTVSQSGEVVLVPSSNVGFGEVYDEHGEKVFEGYLVRLSTLKTETDVISIVLGVSAYKNNKVATVSSYSWSSLDQSKVGVNNNSLYSVAEGFTTVIGECVISGKTYEIEIGVEVYRPQILLDEHFEVELGDLETESMQALTLDDSSDVRGSFKDLLYEGESVGTFDEVSKTLTLDKTRLPKSSAKMGENRVLSLETTKASYLIELDLYTKIIKTAEDLNKFAVYAKQANPDKAIWDGYFILGDDIKYNGVYDSQVADLNSLWSAVGGSWSNGGLYGFKGVIDGRGHYIEGLTIGNGTSMNSFIGVLHIDGVIKNLSFTKATVMANSSLVCAAGGGSVENVYVEYVSMGEGTQHYEADGETINNYSATFFGFKEPIATANVTNCVIDVIDSEFNPNASIKIVGSEYVAIKNVFVIGGTDDLRAKSNATLSFVTVEDFVKDVNAQSRYKKFDKEFWSKEKGVAISNAVYELVKDNGVEFVKSIGCLVSGTAYKFSVDNKYVTISTQSSSLSISNGVATVLDGATDGETVKVIAKPIFNEQDEKELTVNLRVVDLSSTEDLTTGEELAFYDTTVKAVYYNEKLKQKIQSEVLYFVNEDFSAISFSRVGEPIKTIFAVCEDKLYKINCKSVTKVIAEKEDLHYVRRNYCLSGGLYDGKILGEFVMVNDIDATGLVLANTGIFYENARGFGGTFDGMGHTISNLTVSNGGLFGNLAFATIKNVNFTNVNLTGNGAYIALFASSIFNSQIEDVKVHFKSNVYGANPEECSGLLFYAMTWDSFFTNVTLDVSDLDNVDRVADLTYYDKTDLANVKSVYKDVTVLVKDKNVLPKYAYKNGWSSTEEVELPSGIIFKEKEQE